MLTPQTQLFLENIKALNLPSIETIPVEILRSNYETLAMLYGGIRDSSIPFHDQLLNLPNIDKPIRVRSFHTNNPKAIILYAHGGGWTQGSLNTHHVMCQKLAKSTDSQVVSIEYSLAPEHPYPAALNEIEAVYKWAVEQYCFPINVAGDSGGANLMAGLIVRLNNLQISLPNECIFFYPSFDLTGKLDSLKEFAEGYSLTKNSIEYYVNNYLNANLALTTLPEVSPLWVMKDIDFPSTLIIAAEKDPLRDDSRIAAKMLEEKGKLKGHLEVPGVIHAFAQFPGLFPEATKVFEWINKFYKP